jgi:hypothetical protein
VAAEAVSGQPLAKEDFAFVVDVSVTAAQLVACVREAFEETGLRVTVRRPVAKFESAWYFLCSLNNGRDDISLAERECIDACWVMPNDLLGLGTVMDLRRIIPLLELSGFRAPSLPRGLEPAVPEQLF